MLDELLLYDCKWVRHFFLKNFEIFKIQVIVEVNKIIEKSESHVYVALLELRSESLYFI